MKTEANSVHYPENMTLAEARAVYFEANGFGPTGGYDDAWVDFTFFTVPFPIPNTEGRKRVVGRHDLHHILTGYTTDMAGEMDVAAWEIGAGCNREATAWLLNLGMMGLGAVIAPRRTWRAFVRGRRARSLYDGRPEADYLGRTVSEVRREIGLDRPDAPAPGPVDVAAVAGFGALGVATGLATMSVFSLLLPVGLYSLLKRRRARVPAEG